MKGVQGFQKGYKASQEHVEKNRLAKLGNTYRRGKVVPRESVERSIAGRKKLWEDKTKHPMWKGDTLLINLG